MDDEMVCYCKGVRRSVIVDAIKKGAKSVKDIQKETKACTGNKCKEMNPKKRCCHVDVVEILKEFDITDNSLGCCRCSGDCC